MARRFIDVFVSSTSAILFFTAAAKLLSSLGAAPILHEQDPIFGMPYEDVFLLSGFIEMTIAYFCFFGKRFDTKIYLICWLATALGLYRLGLILVHYRKPCSCLGSLTDYIHLDSAASDLIMDVIFTYLLVGGYAALFWLWRQKQKAS